MSRIADYEGRVLRSAILYPEDVLFQVLYSLKADDFKTQEWKKAFVDLKSIAETGKNTSESIIDGLEAAGNNTEVIIDSWDSVYSGETIEEPIKEIKNRTFLKELGRIYEIAQEETKKTTTDGQKHITRIMGNLSKLIGAEEDKTSEQVIDSLKEGWSKYVGKKCFGVPMGIPAVDEITKGMQQGHFWLLGAYTSYGKSWFATRIMREFLHANKHVLYLSFEMGAEELMWRLAVCDMEDKDINLFNAKTQTMPNGKLEDLNAHFEMMKLYPVKILDSLSTFDEIKLRILHAVHSGKADCIIVDYLQNIIVPKSQSEYDSLNKVVLELQTIARKYKVFILALSQVNRESQKSSNDQVFGFKGSGNLENAADIAITVNKPENDESKRVVVIGKNREGMTGKVTVDVDLSRGYIKQSVMQIL